MTDVSHDDAHPLTRALVDAHAATLDNANAAATGRLVDLLEQFETDIAPMLRPILAHVIDHPDTPEPLRDMLATIANPEHFGESILIGIAVGSVLSPVLGAATAPWIQTIENARWPTDPNIPLTPAELAAARLKGVMDAETQRNLSALSGVSRSNAETLYQIAGQAPGIMEALLLLRRNQIDDAEFAKIVHYSNIRTDFLPDLLALRYLPPSVGEVVTGRLKGHLTDPDYKTKLAHAGIDPVEGDWLRQSAGRPPSPLEMTHLWNRHEAGDPTSQVTEADVDAAVRQSDINDDFLDAVKALRWYIPPVRTVTAMHRGGGLTDAEATQLYKENGVRPNDIPAYLAETTKTRATAQKQVAASQVFGMYESQFVTRDEAVARLVALHYHEDDANLLLDFADQRRDDTYRNAIARKVGTLYIAHKVTLAQASAALSTAGIPSTAQHQFVQTWDVEREANVQLPTPAMVVGAYRREDIDAVETKRRLMALGVQQEDLHIFVADGYPPTRQDRKAILAVVNAKV